MGDLNGGSAKSLAGCVHARPCGSALLADRQSDAARAPRAALRRKVGTSVSCGGNPTSGDRHGSVRFHSPCAAAWLRASVLAPYVRSYWGRLIERRDASNTTRAYLCVVAHFARWSRRRRLDLDALVKDVQCFVGEHLPHCSCPYPVQRSRHQIPAALGHLQAVLGDAVIQSGVYRVDPVEDELRRFDEQMQTAVWLYQDALPRAGEEREAGVCSAEPGQTFTWRAGTLRDECVR